MVVRMPPMCSATSAAAPAAITASAHAKVRYTWGWARGGAARGTHVPGQQRPPQHRHAAATLPHNSPSASASAPGHPCKQHGHA
jgi:hypothetical protein